MRRAWRELLRDARAGEPGILAAALLIAVASVTSVGFFADRVGQALVRDAHQLLGADVVLVAELAGHRRLDTTRRYSLPSEADRDAAVEALLGP